MKKKKPVTFPQIVRHLLNQRVITPDGKRLSRKEAILRTVIDLSMAKDPRAMRVVMNMMKEQSELV